MAIILMVKGYITSRMVMSTKDNSKKENEMEGGYITTSARISKRERKIKCLEVKNTGV